MNVASVRRWLKVADPTAITARETLQRVLGFGRSVREVYRSEVWVLRADEHEDLAGLLDRLCKETNLLVNPNKHFLEIRQAAEPHRPLGNTWILVWTPGSGAEMSTTLVRHGLVPGDPPAIRRATLWGLDLEGNEDERRERARSMSLAVDRKQGLFANPQLEDAEVFLEPPAPERLAAVLKVETSTPLPGMG